MSPNTTRSCGTPSFDTGPSEPSDPSGTEPSGREAPSGTERFQRSVDSRAALSDQPADTVAIPMSTGRSIIVPADLLVTVIDLASPVDP